MLEAFNHPYFAVGDSKIQNDMIDEMRQWLDDFKEVEREIAISGLTKVNPLPSITRMTNVML